MPSASIPRDKALSCKFSISWLSSLSLSELKIFSLTKDLISLRKKGENFQRPMLSANVLLFSWEFQPTSAVSDMTPAPLNAASHRGQHSPVHLDIRTEHYVPFTWEA